MEAEALLVVVSGRIQPSRARKSMLSRYWLALCWAAWVFHLLMEEGGGFGAPTGGRLSVLGASTAFGGLVVNLGVTGRGYDFPGEGVKAVFRGEWLEASEAPTAGSMSERCLSGLMKRQVGGGRGFSPWLRPLQMPSA
jgi:hypothetical protein